MLLTLSAGSFFYHAFLSCSELSVKLQAHATLSEKKDAALEKIKIPIASFDKHKGEVWFQGRLYDIASYHVVNDTVVISVLHDEKEEALVSIINDYFSSPNDSYCSYNGHHISARHSFNPNDVKCLSEGINIPYGVYASALPATGDLIEYPVAMSQTIDSPPPKA